MLLLLIAAATSASPTPPCKLNLERGDTVVERRTLKVRNGMLEAVAVSKSGAWKGDPTSRMMVLGPECELMFSQRFDDAKRVLFTAERLGKQPFLFVTAYRPGGSGAGFGHAILKYGGEMFAEDGVEPLAPTSLNQGNMDGIFVGDLGHGRGPGLVLWNAQWNGLEAHYEPHQYEIVTYRWRNGRFIGPIVRTTQRKYDPDPDDVARRLGLGFKDMTQQRRFGWR